MKLYSYIVKYDRGLAPNPFHGYCTLAVCTPNHMGIKPEKGDWIAGFSSKSEGNKLVYAMQVSETMHFKDYFYDARFQNKKPQMDGNWKERCGDNFYEFKSEGKPVQHLNPFHEGVEYCQKDTKHPYVFIAEHFYYFGEEAVSIPVDFQVLVYRYRGYKYNFKESVVEGFLAWLKQNWKPGISGNPQHRELDCEKGC